MCAQIFGDIRQNLSSIKNIRFVKQLVSTGIIFINHEVPALHWYLPDRELDGSSCRSWSTSVQLSFLEMFWHLLTPLYSQNNGYKATKFDDYEDCETTLDYEWDWKFYSYMQSPAGTSTDNLIWHESIYVIFSLKMFDCL